MTTKDAYSTKKAMDYECFIRRIYSCGRYGTEGADADIYRSFIMRAVMYRDEKKAINEALQRTSTKSEQELLAEYMKSLHEVVGYINVAILKALNTHRSLFSKEQILELENTRKLLAEPSVEVVVKVIETVDEITLSVGLYPE